ncbi:hypothetical protein AI29_05880, partial [bacteria symbiont BFo2 of Frankliniella occidentalis]
YLIVSFLFNLAMGRSVVKGILLWWLTTADDNLVASREKESSSKTHRGGRDSWGWIFLAVSRYWVSTVNRP